MNSRTITDNWEYFIVGTGFAILFLPMHIIYDGFWAMNRMGWWIGFLICINEAYKEYKENKKPVITVPSVWHPTLSAWANRWGVSWRTLGIVIPTMLITFFFAMLVVFA